MLYYNLQSIIYRLYNKYLIYSKNVKVNKKYTSLIIQRTRKNKLYYENFHKVLADIQNFCKYFYHKFPVIVSRFSCCCFHYIHPFLIYQTASANTCRSADWFKFQSLFGFSILHFMSQGIFPTHAFCFC